MKKEIFFLLVLFHGYILSQTLNLPARPANAPTGSQFAASISSMTLDARENAIYSQVMSGNIPPFMRTLVPVTVNGTAGGINHTVTMYVLPDYLAIGSDSNYFFVPTSAPLAQKIATALQCALPTRKMVNDIYSAASVKLAPIPIPWSDANVTVPVFLQHSDTVHSQRAPTLAAHPLSELVGGTKKDIVISNLIYNSLKTGVPKPVVIYGWHYLNGTPIQPLYNGHAETYMDYSHGVRLVQMAVTIDGNAGRADNILKDAALNSLLSDEGAIPIPYYSQAPLVITPPKSFCVLRGSATSLRILVSGLNDTTTCAAYLSKDGLLFTDFGVTINSPDSITTLPTDSICYIRLQFSTPGGKSSLSEVLAAVPSASLHNALVVSGFDRAVTGNTYNFIRQHGRALWENGTAFSSATNEAVLNKIVSLGDFANVDYILGNESTADETFSTAEQESVKTFLRGGGRLFVSGAEIGWDLDYKGSVSDKEFYNQYLKSQFIADNPGASAGLYHSLDAVAGRIFDGLPKINFDDGTHGTFNVNYPDVINGVNGGVNCMAYSDIASTYAGVSFEGVFPSGSKPGKVVTLGVPFEAMYPDSLRTMMMKKILTFFSTPVSVKRETAPLPEGFELSQNYPNPFNGITNYELRIRNEERVTLRLYDALGREIAVLVDGILQPGVYRVRWNASEFASGVYYCVMSAGSFRQTRRTILMK